MKIALIGYGNMGREIEKLVSKDQSHTVISISYKTLNDRLDVRGLKQADVAIDFTSPQIVMKNIATVLSLGIPLVVGTTGWYDNLPHVKQLVKKSKAGLIYGQNFSIGANMFFNIINYASNLAHKYEDYDVFGIETHHVGKKDSPSGTARKLAGIIMKNEPRKKILQTEKLDRQIHDDELHFVAVRGGRSFGRHEIIFDSSADEIRLTHQAWGRSGFAKGALVAASYILNKKGLYNFSDIFQDLVSK